MRFEVPDHPIAMTMLWMWLALVCAAVVAYKVLRWWRKRHPPPKPEPPKSYTIVLRERLNARRADKRRTKSKPVPTRPPKA